MQIKYVHWTMAEASQLCRQYILGCVVLTSVFIGVSLIYNQKRQVNLNYLSFFLNVPLNVLKKDLSYPIMPFSKNNKNVWRPQSQTILSFPLITAVNPEKLLLY